MPGLMTAGHWYYTGMEINARNDAKMTKSLDHDIKVMHT